MKIQEKSNNSNNNFFTFAFLYRKTYILLENIFGKTQFILLYLHYSYWKCSNTNTHIDIHWFCRRHTLIKNTWLQTRYFKVDFDSIGFFLLFIYFRQVPSIQEKKSIKLDNQFHYKKYKERDRNISKTFVFISHHSI